MKERVIFDYSLLRGKIREKTGTEGEFARLLGMTPAALSCRLKNKTDFTPTEIIRAQKLLLLTNTQIGRYFFTIKVQKSEL